MMVAKYIIKASTCRPHFLNNSTLSCPTCGMLLRSACHWLTHNFQNHSLPLIGWHSLLLILFSHQPRPAAAVHWTCSVATLFVGLSGTNLPSHFVPKFKSVGPDQSGSESPVYFLNSPLVTCSALAGPRPPLYSLIYTAHRQLGANLT